MLVLAGQALLTPYREGDGLVLALLGEGHMDTPMLAGELVGVVAGDVDSAGAGQHLTHIPGSEP